MSLNPAEVTRAQEVLGVLREEVGKAIVGQRDAVDQVLVALLAAGHVLIEGVPGLGKTLLARALGKAMALQVSRVQFTPDLMPSDITGHAVLDRSQASADNPIGTLRVLRGPVFTHLLVADEINRAPAKTQAALLEVMQEAQVTLEGHTLLLDKPFMVLATQNPLETEGTYPLPEAQLDRFLLKIDIGYPTRDEEGAIVERATAGQAGDQLPLEGVQPRVQDRHIITLQQMAAAVRVDARITDYAVRITRATRGAP